MKSGKNLVVGVVSVLAATAVLAGSLVFGSGVVGERREETSVSQTQYVGKKAAKASALKHAGVKADDAEFTKVKRDKEDGVYDVEFFADGFEYDYDIDALTGKVVKHDRDKADKEDYAEAKEEQKNNPKAPESTKAPETTKAPESTTAAQPSYVGVEKAKQAALSHAGVSASNARFEKAELDHDDGRTVYEVDFRSGSWEYDYEVDALSGKVLKADKEYDAPATTQAPQTTKPVVQTTQAPQTTKPVPQTTQAPQTTKPAPQTTQAPQTTAAPSYVGVERAKQAALSYAGVSAASATFVKAQLDFDDGRAVYELEFRAGSWEYDCDVDAYSGKVLSFDKEYEAPKVPQTTQPAPQTTKAPETTVAPQPTAPSRISMSEAKSKALSHAGVRADAAVFTDAEYDDGYYELEFRANGREYEYKVNAFTGAVVKSHSEPLERDDDDDDDVPVTDNYSYVGTEKAKQAALAHAGLSTARFSKVNLDVDDGRAVYEVEFFANGYDYEYEVDALSGKVLHGERERDD